MDKPLVVVTEPISPEAIELLGSFGTVRLLNHPSEDELAAEVAEARALLNKDASTQVTARVLEAGRNLKIAARHGAGYDNVDLEAATRLGIVVTYTPGANSDAVAEFAITMMLSLARNYVRGNNSVMRGEWDRRRLMGTELRGKTLGIVGLGNIGGRVARMARALGMGILFYDPYARQEVVAELGATSADTMEDLLSRADVVSLHSALTPETRGLIDERRLALMKPSAFLINSARGAMVDLSALHHALAEKRIAGAALDVFPQEPLPADSPLRQLDNVLLTPHLASSTVETQRRTAVTAAEEIQLVLSGQRPRFALNPEVFDRPR